jgi:hypothetical protein
MDTDPPLPAAGNPLNPWALSNPKKKIQKIQKIAGFFTKKSKEAIRKALQGLSSNHSNTNDNVAFCNQIKSC